MPETIHKLVCDLVALLLQQLCCLGFFLQEIHGKSQEPLLTTVKRWKCAWFGHVTCHDSLSKTTLQGTLTCGRHPGMAEEMLDGQHQRVDIPAQARAAHKGLLQKRPEEDLC